MKTVFNNAAQIKSVLRDLHNQKESSKALIIAISGIEGCGKRALTEKVAAALILEGVSVAVIHGDDWEASESVRFNVMSSPEEYYLNAYRFDEMFEQLILPLKLFGSIKTSVTLDDVMNPRTVEYDFNDIDIILIEGVYLLQEAYLDLYDYTCWVDSDFDAAFARLVRLKNIEQSQDALIRLFELLIKPAGQYHIYSDNPQGHAKSLYIEQETNEDENKTVPKSA
ncbi:uridine kinase family protein [Psychromonas antarctica]|uniref:uridine kinase family protein n=1 Tax=Psychromonas antarctica TaxID=67573 RepID=UPI001EE9A944|nr:uridine kinase [Psychromonas antarctica]MCG6200729.1 uridine kinase [Psychromonas antarctica]